MALGQTALTASLVQLQGQLAMYLPLPPCVYGCSSPDQCLYALVVAFLHALLGPAC